jgi:hypothetical protein
MPEVVVRVDQVQAERLVEVRVVVVGLEDAVTRQQRATDARVHVEAEHDVVVVVRVPSFVMS